MGTCENCGRTLGALEIAGQWDGHTVCSAFHAELSNTDFSHIADDVFRDLPLGEGELVSEQKRRIAEITGKLMRMPCPLCQASLPKDADHCNGCGWRRHGRHGFEVSPAWLPPA